MDNLGLEKNGREEVLILYIIKGLGKVIISGFIAFAILTGLCNFYYNVPIQYECEDGSTDYKWTADKFYARVRRALPGGIQIMKDISI